MKYSIHINQLVLSKTKLDLVDSAILDYLIYYCNSKSSKIEKQRISYNNERWTWVKLDTLLEDMPILGIHDKGTCAKRIKKIEDAGYLKIYRENNRRQYYVLTKKVDELFVEGETVGENQQSPEPELLAKTNSTVGENQQDNNTNDNNKNYVRGKNSRKNHVSDNDVFIEELLSYWNSLYASKWKGVSTLRTNYEYWLRIYTPDEIKQAVANIKHHEFWRGKMTPSILLRQKNPRREDVDYIGEMLHTKSTPVSNSGYVNYDDLVRQGKIPG